MSKGPGSPLPPRLSPAQPIPPCPNPQACPVALDRLTDLASNPGSLQLCTMASRSWHRVYSARDTFESPNPGIGSTRFAPFPNLVTDTQVPTLYLAESLDAALLETVFHNVDASSNSTVISRRDLHGHLHAEVLPPRELTLIDLRDPELKRLQIERGQLVTSPAEHYPCTRRVAQILHGLGTSVDGLLWHSRQAEQHGLPKVEVAVVFCDRVPSTRGSWQLHDTTTALGALNEGAGLDNVNQIVVRLGLTLS